MFREEMSLIGFIPFSLYSYINQNDRLIVTPYYIRFAQIDNRIPIFDTIKTAQGEKYIIDNNFVVDICLNENEGPMWGAKLMTGEDLHKQINKKRIPNFLKGSFEQKDDKSIYYIGRENEWELSREHLPKTVIVHDFLCLCSYINMVTGLPSYALLSSTDTIRILSNEDEQNAPLNPFNI